MLSAVHKRSQKAGQAPGTAIYTGSKKSVVPKITVMTYSETEFFEKSGRALEDCMLGQVANPTTTWIDVQGLNDPHTIEILAEKYKLHPLTVEDILNVEQRSKIEEFDTYIFVTLKMLVWHAEKRTFSIEELSLVMGEGFVLTFQEQESSIFNELRERISKSPQSMRKKTSDYMAYRLIDTVVDYYFVVLEGMGEQIEKVEDLIIANPSKKNARMLYKLKRQMLLLRKVSWPIREVISHLLKVDNDYISPYTQVYFRDVYDHTMQAIDTIETFRDMLSNMLDIYLSSLTNRMNEIMKVLTIIATIFMPITFITSLYGMNFQYMPELSWVYGYPIVLTLMACVVMLMLAFFRRKKWL
jgi:magnesium transporter